jgi:hypothetical protein
MLAGFTSVAKPLPLDAVREAERTVLAQLLLDAIRSHYWSMSNDPRMAVLSQGNANSRQAFVVGRRVVMLKAMMDVLGQLAADQFTPVQRAELVRWRQNLDQAETYAVRTVAMLYARASQANGPDQSIVDIKACPGLKNGILASVRNGTATITSIE